MLINFKKLPNFHNFLEIWFNSANLAAALYNWSMMPNKLEMNAALICASHFCYLFSFIRCVKKWWKSLACITAFFICMFHYTVFFDLFRSLPIVVVVCCMTNAVIAVSFVAAGSVWKRGSNIAYAETVSSLNSSLINFI